MKIIIVLVSTLLLSMPIYSSAEDDICGSLESLAGRIMESRQNDIPMSALVNELTKMEDKKLADLVRQMIIDAYEISSYSSDSYKEKAVLEYRNSIYLECIKARKNSK